MWPDKSSKFMTCIVCLEKLTSFKLSTIKRHIERKHNTSMQYDLSKRRQLVADFVSNLSRQQSLMKKAISRGPGLELYAFKKGEDISTVLG